MPIEDKSTSEFWVACSDQGMWRKIVDLARAGAARKRVCPICGGTIEIGILWHDPSCPLWLEEDASS